LDPAQGPAAAHHGLAAGAVIEAHQTAAVVDR